MSKRYMILSELTLFVVMLIGSVHASRQGQTNRLKWEESARADIAMLFETILKSADYQAATDMVTKYEQQEPVKEKLGEVVVKNPLQEFLRAPYGNYPGLPNQRPLQGIFYERARETRADARQENLDAIARLFIEKTEPGFFTEPLMGTIDEKIMTGESKTIPYLLFALRYTMPKVAQKLLDKAGQLAQAKVDGRSAYSYAFEGGISDSELIKRFGTSGALVQEADFDHFTDHAKKAGFLSWLVEHGVSLKNIVPSKIEGLKKEAEALAAQQLMNRFTNSLQVLVQG